MITDMTDSRNGHFQTAKQVKWYSIITEKNISQRKYESTTHALLWETS